MLRHVVLFSWNDSATAADRQAVEDGLAALPGVVPEIRRYEFGADARLGAAGQYWLGDDKDD